MQTTQSITADSLTGTSAVVRRGCSYSAYYVFIRVCRSELNVLAHNLTALHCQVCHGPHKLRRAHLSQHGHAVLAIRSVHIIDAVEQLHHPCSCTGTSTCQRPA